MLASLRGFSMRTGAVLVKEFLQLRRDRTTFAMMIMVPLIQLVLFGYAINANPRHLPTAVLAHDNGPQARAVLAALQATDYFDIVAAATSDAEIDRLIHSGEVMFVVEIPARFSRDVRRGLRPQLLVIADAADPTAAGSAIAALEGLAANALRHERATPQTRPASTPFEVIVHRRYNPAQETNLNIVPGLIGTILTLTMVIFPALAVTREIERGTMENLLAMPIRPSEVMLGKIAPYVLVGAVQVALILGAARLLFGVPVEGSLALLLGLTMLFIVANLAIGYTFSTIARNQLQAMQMAVMFFLPSILLSGFLFPFLGMPRWAQWLGEALPLTHFLRIVRGIMLKSASFADLSHEVLALAVFTIAAMALAAARYRQTLD
jgi:ABC-2 type transport system permease protein